MQQPKSLTVCVCVCVCVCLCKRERMDKTTCLANSTDLEVLSCPHQARCQLFQTGTAITCAQV